MVAAAAYGTTREIPLRISTNWRIGADMARDQAKVLEDLKTSKFGSLQWKTALDWANEVTLNDLRLFYEEDAKWNDAVAIIDNRLRFMNRKKTGEIPVPSPARKEKNDQKKRENKPKTESRQAQQPSQSLYESQEKPWTPPEVPSPKKDKPKKKPPPSGHKLRVDMLDGAWIDDDVDAEVPVKTYPDMAGIEEPQCYMCAYVYKFLVEKKTILPDRFEEDGISSVKNCVWHWNLCFCGRHPELKLQAIALGQGVKNEQ